MFALRYFAERYYPTRYFARGGIGFGVSLSPGSYTLTGQPADLVPGKKVFLSPGSYRITGNPAIFGFNVRLSPGSFRITGNPVDFGIQAPEWQDYPPEPADTWEDVTQGEGEE